MVLNSSNASEKNHNHNLDEAIAGLKVHDNHEGGEVDSNQYPHRPGEPDCIYYMKTGLCGYGSKCRYNHPTHYGQGTQAKDELPERVGQPDCQYFLKRGMCKFGATCKYHHPRNRHEAQLVPLNLLGLPLRQDQKSCLYYMRTGTCRFGVVCKFNHPQPATLGTVLPLPGPPAYGSTIPSVASTGGALSYPLSNRPTYMPSHHSQNLAAYMPVILPPSPGAMPGQQGWPAYMGSISAESILSSIANFPERPDQPECHHYMKTGNCKYGANCKFHHPKKSSSSAGTLGPLGLPLRPGQPVCSHYSQHGTCRFGPVCKFDHPFYGCYNIPAICYPDPAAHFPAQNTAATDN